jgi:urea-proton symporter
VVLAILIGMPIYETQGELIGTLSIVAISGLTVLAAGFFGSERFDVSTLRQTADIVIDDGARVAIAEPAE